MVALPARIAEIDWLQRLPATSRWAWVCLIAHTARSTNPEPGTARWPSRARWRRWGVSRPAAIRLRAAAEAAQAVELRGSDYHIPDYELWQVSSTARRSRRLRARRAAPDPGATASPSDAGRLNPAALDAILLLMPRSDAPGLPKKLARAAADLHAAGVADPGHLLLARAMEWRTSADGQRGVFARHPVAWLRDLLAEARQADTRSVQHAPTDSASSG